MTCSYCKKEVPSGREICPECNHPIKPIPIPPGGKIHFGEYDWYVLDRQDGKALVITEKVIEKRVYNNQECEITWETCDLRKYLNGDFYDSFSAADRERIIEVTNENNDNPWYGASGGNPTTDRIFLLSISTKVHFIKEPPFLHINRCIRDANEVIGGILSEVYWNILRVDILWVKEGYRNKGYATALTDCYQ